MTSNISSVCTVLGNMNRIWLDYCLILFGMFEVNPCFCKLESAPLRTTCLRTASDPFERNVLGTKSTKLAIPTHCSRYKMTMLNYSYSLSIVMFCIFCLLQFPCCTHWLRTAQATSVTDWLVRVTSTKRQLSTRRSLSLPHPRFERNVLKSCRQFPFVTLQSQKLVQQSRPRFNQSSLWNFNHQHSYQQHNYHVTM